MKAREAYRMIQWYDVYRSETLSYDDEDLYIQLLHVLKDCHDIVENNNFTYHQLYEIRMLEQERGYDSDFDE